VAVLVVVDDANARARATSPRANVRRIVCASPSDGLGRDCSARHVRSVDALGDGRAGATRGVFSFARARGVVPRARGAQRRRRRVVVLVTH